MKSETARLILLPCDSQSAQVIEAQHYENGPQIADHVKELKTIRHCMVGEAGWCCGNPMG